MTDGKPLKLINNITPRRIAEYILYVLITVITVIITAVDGSFQNYLTIRCLL